MNSSLLKGYEDAPSDPSCERVLINWLKATIELYTNHQTLTGFIQKGTLIHSDSSANGAYIGQCPTAQLRFLVSTMEAELQNLIQDLSTLKQDGMSVHSTSYRKLITQTQTLNRLNQQAQTRFLLMSSETA